MAAPGLCFNGDTSVDKDWGKSLGSGNSQSRDLPVRSWSLGDPSTRNITKNGVPPPLQAKELAKSLEEIMSIPFSDKGPRPMQFMGTKFKFA